MAEALTSPEHLSMSWSGASVGPERIEAQLARLRYEVAGSPEAGMHLAPRTSLLTLVVIAPDTETANAANHLIDVLPSHHPSRSIIVVPIPNADESRIDAQLAAHCHFTQGAEHPVCCEDVMLTAAAAHPGPARVRVVGQP